MQTSNAVKESVLGKAKKRHYASEAVYGSSRFRQIAHSVRPVTEKARRPYVLRR